MSVSDNIAAARSSVVDTTVHAGDALRFAHDLGGSLTHVLVAAVGRTLAASPDVEAILDDRVGASGVGLALTVRRRRTVSIVAGAESDPLPNVRASLDRILAAAREGRIDFDDSPTAAVTVVEHVPIAIPLEAVPLDQPCVLEASLVGGDPAALELCLHFDGRILAPVQAEDMLSQIASLLERPYRRLV